jgi:hypothetical protein
VGVGDWQLARKRPARIEVATMGVGVFIVWLHRRSRWRRQSSIQLWGRRSRRVFRSQLWSFSRLLPCQAF